jgi:DNA-binding transcriptional regulator YdaS (Cro superfamily)
MNDLVAEAVGLFGSQGKLARACGVKQSSIWNALNSPQCSPKLAMAIEFATNGKIKANQLRPDLRWPASAPKTSSPDNTAARAAGSSQHPIPDTAISPQPAAGPVLDRNEVQDPRDISSSSSQPSSAPAGARQDS